MTSTVITALFDIERESAGDGRKIDDYLIWLDKTLKLNVNIVIFTEPKFKDFILARRSTDNTKVIISNLDSVPYFKYNSAIESVLSNPDYQSKIRDSNRIECRLSLYNVIQYSKFEWIREAIQNQYFDTEFYFWMDAGCSRFFENFDTEKPWPQNYNIINFNKFNCQGNINTSKYENNWPGEDFYIYENNCFIVGTLFGGGKEICIKIADLVRDKFEYFLSKQIVNNEQIILGILYQENKDNFSVITYLNGHHLPFFSILG
jgi:hypothetical protein